MRPIITLLTDFGLRDSYVAEVKGVILSICPEACIVDLSHQVEAFNVRMGAYLLARAAPYFPEGTIHVAVVDPGVGGGRKPILVEAEKGMLVGPDNGLLIPAARKLGMRKVYEITGGNLLPERFTETFHGRDIFAPTAALLARGVPPGELGRPVESWVEATFQEASIKAGRIRGEVVHVDGFGNLVTNIGWELLEAVGVKVGSKIKVTFKNGKTLKLKLSKAYVEAPAGSLLALVGSWGTLEVSANQADASRMLKVSAGDEVAVEPAAT